MNRTKKQSPMTRGDARTLMCMIHTHLALIDEIGEAETGLRYAHRDTHLVCPRWASESLGRAIAALERVAGYEVAEASVWMPEECDSDLGMPQAEEEPRAAKRGEGR